MIKKFINRRYEKHYGINLVKAHLKKRDGLLFEEIKHFSALEDEYISLLKEQEIFLLDLELRDVEYELKRRYIKNQNTNRDLDMATITFILSACLLYMDDFKYEKIRDFSLTSFAVVSLIFALFLFMNYLSRIINDSNGLTLYYEFKKECLKKAIKYKNEAEIDSHNNI